MNPSNNPWAAMHSWHEVREIAQQNSLAREVPPPPLHRCWPGSISSTDRRLMHLPAPRVPRREFLALWQSFRTATPGEFCLNHFTEYCTQHGYAGCAVGTTALRALKRSLILVRPATRLLPATYRFPEVRS